MAFEQYLKETRLLDYSHPTITRLVSDKQWERLDEFSKIEAVYNFVMDDIVFGFNESDDIPASSVLRDGYGQCNTKSTVLMALLRKVGIPCRIHGFGIDKSVQRGVVPGFAYRLSPMVLLHTWTEVLYDGTWVDLEGCILDRGYLSYLQNRFSGARGSFCGYAVATADLQNPPVEWNGKDTYIQKDAIVSDHGEFDSPDELYDRFGVNASGIKAFLFKHIVRKWMNRRVANLRAGRYGRTRPVGPHPAPGIRA